MVSGVKLDKFDMQVSLKRLHAPTYERLMQYVLAGASHCDAVKAAAADPQQVLALMQQGLGALLPFNPEYALDRLAVEIEGERGELSYSLGVQGVSEADLQLPLPALLMGKATFKGQASLPVAWVEKTLAGFGGAQADPAVQAQTTRAMLDKMTVDGFVVREGGQLSTQFSFDKGQMVVNGKPIGPAGAMAHPPAPRQ